MHTALEQLHKEVAESNERSRTNAQRFHNAKSKVVPENVHIGDYVTIYPARIRRHKLNVGWIGPMRIIEAKSDLVIVVEDGRKRQPKPYMCNEFCPIPRRRVVMKYARNC